MENGEGDTLLPIGTMVQVSNANDITIGGLILEIIDYDTSANRGYTDYYVLGYNGTNRYVHYLDVTPVDTELKVDDIQELIRQRCSVMDELADIEESIAQLVEESSYYKDWNVGGLYKASYVDLISKDSVDVVSIHKQTGEPATLRVPLTKLDKQ